MPASLTLHLNGSFRLLDAAGTAVTGLSRRGQALLAFLAQQPAMRAERGLLADLLWSDRAQDQARASLRQELSALRRALPEGVLGADRQCVWLDPARVSADTTGPGDFLQGFDLPSEGFEDWLRQQRATAEPRHEPPATARPERARPTLAILPFDELGAPETDMFADGVVEEITGALSRVHEFHVIARQSAFALRGQALSIPETATRLGADYIVEGSVRRSGDRVRISVQLVRGSDGHTLWSERFDDRLDDLFALQDRIASQVAGQISPNLRMAEILRATAIAPEQQTAYSLTLQALPHFWRHEKASQKKAIALFDRALEQAPDYHPALAYKAWALAQQPTYMWSDNPARDRRTAIELVRTCQPLVGGHAPALVALSAAISMSVADRRLAIDLAQKALSIDPNNAWGWMRLGWSTLHLPDSADKAIGYFDKARALSPLDPFMFSIRIGKAASLAARNDLPAAIDLLQATMREWPDISWVYRELTSYLARAGRMDEAIVAARRYHKAYPDLTIRRIQACAPPAMRTMNPEIFDGLRLAGIPEE